MRASVNKQPQRAAPGGRSLPHLSATAGLKAMATQGQQLSDPNTSSGGHHSLYFIKRHPKETHFEPAKTRCLKPQEKSKEPCLRVTSKARSSLVVLACAKLRQGSQLPQNLLLIRFLLTIPRIPCPQNEAWSCKGASFGLDGLEPF